MSYQDITFEVASGWENIAPSELSEVSGGTWILHAGQNYKFNSEFAGGWEVGLLAYRTNIRVEDAFGGTQRSGLELDGTEFYTKFRAGQIVSDSFLLYGSFGLGSYNLYIVFEGEDEYISKIEERFKPEFGFGGEFIANENISFKADYTITDLGSRMAAQIGIHF